MNKFFTILFAMVLSTMLSANNIAVTNPTLTGKNTVEHYTLVQFDISWENSFRVSAATANHDAAWVFVKYRVAGGSWQQARLSSSGYNAPTGSTIDIGLLSPGLDFNTITNPGQGAFIYRSSNGTGTFDKAGVQLRWNYGDNGVGDNEIVDIQVYAIEMVYIPAGAFYVGDATASNIQAHFEAGIGGLPFQVASEVSLTLGGGGAGSLGNNNALLMFGGYSDDFNDATTKTLPTAYPKGYNAFYCMKYEISQQGYVDFLNSLSYTQQATRTSFSPDSPAGTSALNNTNRNGIDIMTLGVSTTIPAVYACNLNGNLVFNEADDGQNIACNWLNWTDLAAYLDWSGLRPFTELEYEKACRGTLAAVADEYAWGSTTATQAPGIINSGLSNEMASNVGANCVYCRETGVQGPMRVGSFAQQATNRQNSGASYYGIMELSGNLWERTITVGNATGRSFTGMNGDGNLDATGNANVVFWPQIGTSVRGNGEWSGGNWSTDAKFMRVSDRYLAALTDNARYYYSGGRGVRSAATVLTIGDKYQGGKIAYIFQPGDAGYIAGQIHGLIAAISDQSTGIAWWNGSNTTTGATAMAIGFGNANTNSIVSSQGAGSYAAKLCSDLVTGGYSDWYLPSLNELFKLYYNRSILGGFTLNEYWSSTEMDSSSAYVQSFDGNYYANNLKNTICKVRAIRSF